MVVGCSNWDLNLLQTISLSQVIASTYFVKSGPTIFSEKSVEPIGHKSAASKIFPLPKNIAFYPGNPKRALRRAGLIGQFWIEA